LLQIFDLVRFISEYSLIFITGQEETGLRYQIYRGQDVEASDTAILTSDPNLGQGWFYLAKRNNKSHQLLKLYPFLIASGKDMDLEKEGVQSDAALLDRFSSSRIYYLATILWKDFFREDDDLLADFFYNYEKSLGSKAKITQ